MNISQPSNKASKIFSIVVLADSMTIGIIALFSMIALIYPTARAFYHFEINYNEGWNVYNAQAAMCHLPLYYPEYSWTTVNYPLLSFYIVGSLSRFVGDYLLTGRMLSLLSLLLSSLFVCLIAKKLTAQWAPAIFAASFCLALFCTRAQHYVGMDDPQMMAHPLCLAGLLLYISRRPSTALMGLIPFLFVLGGNIKQNLISIPIAVALELLVISRSKAVQFALFSAVFLALSVGVNTLIGGPFFISKLLTPRSYSLFIALKKFVYVYGWLILPLVISVIWAIWQLRNRQSRMISLYFLVSLLVGILLAGGGGVWINAFFDNFFAMSIIMGLCVDYVWRASVPSLGRGRGWRRVAPLFLYSSLIFTFLHHGHLNLPKHLSALPEAQKRFEQEVSFLSAQPGPAICESLLRCYSAGKAYIFDPFNSTNLVRSGKLNSNEIVEQIAKKRYGVIQTQVPLRDLPRPSERFPDDILDAINRYYLVYWQDATCVFYVPRPDCGTK